MSETDEVQHLRRVVAQLRAERDSLEQRFAQSQEDYTSALKERDEARREVESYQLQLDSACTAAAEMRLELMAIVAERDQARESEQTMRQRITSLVVASIAQEREECAKLAETWRHGEEPRISPLGIARHIRARGKPEQCEHGRERHPGVVSCLDCYWLPGVKP